jgi:outer membrane protein TolC
MMLNAVSRGILPWLFFLTLTARIAAAEPVHFNEALKLVVQTSLYQATESDLRAIEWDFESRDLLLQPYLELSAERFNDHRQLLFTSSATKRRADTYSLKLTKPFSTGTSFSVISNLEDALTPNVSPDHRSTMEWQVGITQSLWKDAFGRSTRLRWEREKQEKQSLLADALQKRAQLLTDFEGIYWDWALVLRENKLQEKNLKRSREILKWVQDRFNRAAAERTDLLNAKALLAGRQLQVSALKQRLTEISLLVERYAPGASWTPVPDDLAESRDLSSLVTKWEPGSLDKIIPLEYLKASGDAGAAEINAREQRESIRPEFNLELAYGKNAIDTDNGEAFNRGLYETHEDSTIGVVFRTGLDLFQERKKVEAARALSASANLRKEALETDAKISWERFSQEVQDLKDQIRTSTEYVKLQSQKADEERSRFRMGKTTAFQAITYEQDVAEAEISLWQLYATLRKMEAKARLFAR